MDGEGHMLKGNLHDLLCMLPEDNYITIEMVSKRMKVSKRTVSTRVSELNELLRKNGAFVESKPRYGIRLCVEDKQRFEEFRRHEKKGGEFIPDNMVASGEADAGIVICGTGVGISLAANKVNGIRCVTCSEPYSALLSRQHNNTNMLAFGARVVGIELAKMIVDAWLTGEYEGGRHQRRIDMIGEIEKRQKHQ